MSEAAFSGDEMCQIRIERTYMPYTVNTKTTGIKDYHDTIFGGVVNPLCREIENFNGTHVLGCESAAAYTAWTVVTSNVLYGKQGGRVARLPFVITCNIRTALPQWQQIDSTTTEEREEVRRFEMRTAYHERGHSLACESVAQSIQRFINSMPGTVSDADLDAVNESVRRVIREFYLPMARKADVEYDSATGHGFTQGAEAKDAVQKHKKNKKILV